MQWSVQLTLSHGGTSWHSLARPGTGVGTAGWAGQVRPGGAWSSRAPGWRGGAAGRDVDGRGAVQPEA